MRNLVRGYGLTVKLAWRSSSSQLVLAFAFSVITAVAQPLFALWLKLLVDGVIAHDLAQVTWAAVLLALSDFGLRVLWNFSWPIEYTLQERVALAVDELSVELQEQMPSLEHHERPDYHCTAKRTLMSRSARRCYCAIG